MRQKTLILLKTDCVKRGLIWEVIKRFENVWLKLIAMKMLTPTEELAQKHYPTDRVEWLKWMWNKTLENYKAYNVDPIEQVWTDDAHKIWLMCQGWLIEYLTSGPVVAMVWDGNHTIDVVRKICGFTLPLTSTPGTIRWDYAVDSSYLANANNRAIMNLIHASGEPDEAVYEIDLWFDKSEIMDYQLANDHYFDQYNK